MIIIHSERSRRASFRCAAAATAAAALILSAGRPLPARAESGVSVLCYHAFIDKKKKDPWTFTIDELTSHIDQLKASGFRFVSVWDIVNGRVRGGNNILITVDDGNRSVMEAFAKVFRPNGIRPLLAIYPNVIGRKEYALTWDQLRELAGSGCDIAAHGYCHERLTEKTYKERPKAFRTEIFHSKRVLEEKLGRKILFFVYPFGQRSEPAISMVREAGYRYAFTVDRGRIDVPIAGAAPALELPRYMVDRKSWKYCLACCVKNARTRGQYRVAAADGESVRAAGPVRPLRADPSVPAGELRSAMVERADRLLASAQLRDDDTAAGRPKRKKKQEEETVTGSGAGLISKAAGSAGTRARRVAVIRNVTTAGDLRANRAPRTGAIRAKKEPLIVRAERSDRPVMRRPLPRREPLDRLSYAGPVAAVSIPPLRHMHDRVKHPAPDFSGVPRLPAPPRMDPVTFPGELRETPSENPSPGKGPGNQEILAAKAGHDRGAVHAKMMVHYSAVLDRSGSVYGTILDMVRGKIERIGRRIRNYLAVAF